MDTDDAITALVAYRDEHGPLGGFLTAVLENDLGKVIHHADPTSWQNLKAIYAWVYMEMPAEAWGDPASVKRWQQHRRVLVPTLSDWRQKAPDAKCLSCSTSLADKDLDHYDHPWGWPVQGLKELQWLSLKCDCGYETSLVKLGVPRPRGY